ncbi:ABC transporter permease [Ornithobacterium rhinotracheale]|uniref:ABC transporter permease n=1 Tax=Ornithobacterium rhinotracheale TaxID=28251 RepID=UPI001FF4C247|nr:ABC transporter permease [Ornithobacterium rhinotracheale]MCK0203002.1 ABC transporter permease [Ornithobacterium rhinotracheale]
MKQYFKLQYIMLNRKMIDEGLAPILGYMFIPVAFFYLSNFLFQKIDFANYLMELASIMFQFNLSGKARNNFLSITFSNAIKNKIRIIENLIVALPFLLMLVYNGCFIESIILILISLLLSFVVFRNLGFTIPTPFSNKPFEFCNGFRKSILLFPIAYCVAIIAINVENINLGLFSILLINLTAISYYVKPETEYYVWIYSCSPKSFLREKMSTGTKFLIILNLPILIPLLYVFHAECEIILFIYIVSVLLLWLVILGKYSSYPREMNLYEFIVIIGSVFFLPLSLITIPYFYNKSSKNLKTLLHD